MSCEKVNDKSGEAQSAEVEVQDGAKYVDFDISTSCSIFWTWRIKSILSVTTSQMKQR